MGLAQRGARTAGVDDLVRIEHAEVARWTPPFRPAEVVTNPPYGERLSGGDALERSWNELGRFLKQHCGGATAWVLSGHPALTAQLRLRAARRHPVRNGPLDCRWLRYELLEPRPPASA